jgi:integrase
MMNAVATEQRLLTNRRFCAGVTAHGLRSTFRNWVAEKTDFPGELAEMALAHSVGFVVERAYKRTDLIAKTTRRTCRLGNGNIGFNQ